MAGTTIPPITTAATTVRGGITITDLTIAPHGGGAATMMTMMIHHRGGAAMMMTIRLRGTVIGTAAGVIGIPAEPTGTVIGEIKLILDKMD